MDLILQVRQLIAAAKAGNWKEVVTLALALLTAAADLLPGPIKTKAAAAAGPRSVDELCDELEGHCAAHTMAAGPGAAGGAFISLVLPLIFEILRKRFLASLLLIFVLAFGAASAADLGSPVPPLRACVCSAGAPCECGPGCLCAAPAAKAVVAETVAPPVQYRVQEAAPVQAPQLMQYRVMAAPMVCGPNGCSPSLQAGPCGPGGCGQPAVGRVFRIGR